MKRRQFFPCAITDSSIPDINGRKFSSGVILSPLMVGAVPDWVPPKLESGLLESGLGSTLLQGMNGDYVYNPGLSWYTIWTPNPIQWRLIWTPSEWD